MSAVHGERLIKQLVRADVAEDDDEALGSELGGSFVDSNGEPRHQLSRILRRLSREVVTGTDSRFSILQRTIVFLTTSAVSDEDISSYHAFFRMDPDESFDPEEIDQMEREARRFTGIRLDILTQRLEAQMRHFRIAESMSARDMHSILSQVEEHRTGEGSIITWSALLELVSFGRTDDAASARVSSQRKDRRRLLHAIRQKFDFSSSRFLDVSEYSREMSTDVVSRSRMHRWIRYNLRWDLTKPEMMHVLKEIFVLGSSGAPDTDLQPSASIDESVFRNFLVGPSKRNARSNLDDVIVDIQVGSDPPPGENYYERIRADGESEECNLSMSVFDHKPIFIWFLRRKGIDGIGLDRESGVTGPGTTRLSPIVDIRLESECVSSDLVAAGYTCCSSTSYAFQQRATSRARDLDNSTIKLRVNSVDRHRYLWIRRAMNRMEARDQAIVDLRFTAGRMSAMKDRMHSPPNGTGGWEEVMGRQRRSMPLKRWAVNSVLRTDDLKLWCLRGERAAAAVTARQDRVALCLSSWRRNESVFTRELEKSVQLNLRQRNGRAMEKLTEVSDFSGVFNRHLSPGYRRMGRTGFAELLNSAGLYMAPRERELLFRRLCREASAPGIERQDFVSFLSKTEFELEESAFHLKQVLRRLHRISASQPRQKRLNVRRLKALLEQACFSSEDGPGLRGITIDLFGFMLRCIGEFLSEAEQVRLILRFDPSFSGSVNIDKLMDFVASERDAPTERAERVLLAAQTLAEMVQECDAPTGDTKTAQAWKDLGDRRRLRTSTRSPMLSTMICTIGMANPPDRQLEPEDLVLAVERRAAHAAGVRGALRLSPYEARQLAMLIAPRNLESPGLVSLEQWRNFFVTNKSGTSTRISPRTLGDLLDTLNRPEYLGSVVNAYRKWYSCEDGTEAEDLRSDFVKLRDARIRAVLDDESLSGPHQLQDPLVGVETFSKLSWPYRENAEGDRPFRNASEVALVALHIGADDIRDGNVDVYDEMHCIRVATFVEGVCRIIHGDIEPQEEARLVRINEDASPLALVCDDLRSEIRTGAMEGRASPNYAGWAIGALIEFKVASEVEAQPWLESKKATGVPIEKFTELLARYNDAFGWGLEQGIVESWAKDWDANRDGFVRASDIAQFVDGTSRAAKEDMALRSGVGAGTGGGAGPESRAVAVLSLGDDQAAALVTAVVQQLAPKNSLHEGVRVLHQSFHHPLVDAYPPKGFTTLSGFRRALVTAGVTADPTELAAGLGLFSDKGRIDYELFIRCVRRAWFLGEDHTHGRDGAAAYLGPKLEALRGGLRRAAEQDVSFPRGAKFFNRLDADRDGKLSIEDLETGLQTFKVKHTFSARDLNVLFQYFDDDLERLVDVEELACFILEARIALPPPRETSSKRDLVDAGDDSDDADEDWAELTLAKSRNSKRADPFRDIREAINDRWGTTRDRAALASTLRSKDARRDGRIPEKTFLKFLRRTELMSDLSRRQLQDLLHEMDPSSSHLLNYEEFINQAVLAPGMSKDDLAKTSNARGDGDSTRGSRDTLRGIQMGNSEDPRPALQHILERVSRAHSRGRSFHLAFSDPDSLGLVSKESARRTLERTFGCDLVDAEYHAVFAQLPRRRDGLVDYQALYDLLLLTTPRHGGEPGGGLPQGQLSNGGPFNPLVTPIAPFHGPTSPSYGVMNTSVLPPWVTAKPLRGGGAGGADNWTFGETLGKVRRQLSGGAYGPSAGQMIERAILESGESNRQHLIAVPKLQYLLQNLGVHLSPAEVHSLTVRFAVNGTNAVDYRELSNAIDLARQPTSARTSRESIGRQLQEQQRKGLDVQLIFGMYDKRSSGYVSRRDFKDALGQMSIDLAEADLASLATVYTHEMNPDLVNYMSFLRAHANGVPPLDLNRSIDQVQRPRHQDSLWHQGAAGRSLDDEGSFQRASLDPGPGSSRPFTVEPVVMKPLHSTPYLTAPSRTVDPFFGEPASPVHQRYTRLEGGPRSPIREAARDASLRVWGASVSLENRGKLSKELKRDLDEKGKWMCLYCLYQNQRDTKSCEVCGAANPKARTSSVFIECPNCHHENSEFDTKCSMCGYDLSNSASSRKKPLVREAEDSIWDARDDESGGGGIGGVLDFGKASINGGVSLQIQTAPTTPQTGRGWRD